jgi:hypothetical protein
VKAALGTETGEAQVGQSDINSNYNALVEGDGGADFELPWQRGAAEDHSRASDHILKPPRGGGGGGGTGGGVQTQAQLHADGPTFDSVGLINGSYMIPPDSTSAAGTSGILVAVNGEVQEFDRPDIGHLTVQPGFSLDSVFKSAAGFTSGAFDPRVLYDPASDRFVVVAVDQDPTAHTTHVLVAVSLNGHPHSGAEFSATSIDASGALPGSWADFPQAALDSAGNLYITANMFSFASNQFTGSRLWTVQETGLGVSALVDPSTKAGLSSDLFGLAPTTMTSAGSPAGDYLVSYNSASDASGSNVLNIIHVSAGGYTAQAIRVGHIDQNLQYGGLTAPQPGTTKTIDADDSRTAVAVFQNGHLYVAAAIVPTSGPDAGHTTAHWWAFGTDASGAVTGLLNQGDVSGNTFVGGSQLRSYYPSLAVGQANGHDELAISFSASAPATGVGYDGYPSAYEVTFDPLANTSGTGYQEIGGWRLLAGGQANYYRTFGAHDNRWGDYSSISPDPLDASHGSYWAFNEYAMTNGTSLLGETGRWGTELGLFS